MSGEELSHIASDSLFWSWSGSIRTIPQRLNYGRTAWRMRQNSPADLDSFIPSSYRGIWYIGIVVDDFVLVINEFQSFLLNCCDSSSKYNSECGRNLVPKKNSKKCSVLFIEIDNNFSFVIMGDRPRLCCEFFRSTRFHCQSRHLDSKIRPVCDACQHRTVYRSKWHRQVSVWCFCNANGSIEFDRAEHRSWTYCDRRWMISSMRKMSSLVLPFCFGTPFTLQLTFKLCGSATRLLCTTAGPNGQNVSIDFPMRNWPPLRCFCQSRAEMSCATLYPNTWSNAFSFFTCLASLPTITANSTSQSSCCDVNQEKLS